MTEASDRIESALAAYLEYLEVGGPKPDTSHLSPSEQAELEELIQTLDLTEGVAFGLGRGEETGESRPSSPRVAPKRLAKATRPEHGRRLLSRLREVLPPDVHIASDPTIIVSAIGGMEILEGWIVGTFGGRVRVWLLAADNADDIENDGDALGDLGRVFRVAPETSAIALVAKDLSCLLVRPEDCAPHIEAPGGSLVSRSYAAPIQPVDEAVPVFLRELIPYWDPVPAFGRDPTLSIDVSTIAESAAAAAIDDQRGIGERARKGNPKKSALLDLGRREVTALTSMASALYEGSLEPDEVDTRIRKLAKGR
ncbi:MAG: hypothetical protein ACRDJJ_00835 [Actinomycetota bacterium]